MNKAILAIAGLATLPVLITPKLVGSQFESELQNILTATNQLPGYKAELKSMKSGWFSSEAEVIFSLDFDALSPQQAATQQTQGQQPDAEANTLAVPLIISASHGPIQLGDNPGLSWLQWKAISQDEALRKHLSWPQDKAFYQTTGSLGFNGAISFEDSVAAFKNTETSEGYFSFSGYQGVGSYLDKKLSYSGKVDMVDAKSQAFTFDMAKTTFELDFEGELADLVSGLGNSDMVFNIGSMSFVDAESANDKNQLNDIYVTSTSKMTNDKMDMAMSYGVKSLQSAMLNGQDIAIDVEINNIDANFVRAYSEFSTQLDFSAPEQMQQGLEKFAKDNLLPFLQGEPELNITSLRGTFEQGKIDSQFNSSLVGITTLPDAMQDPSFWLSHTKINGHIKGDKAIIEMLASQIVKSQLQASPQAADMTPEQIEQIALQQAPQMLGMFAQQGFLVIDENSYSSALSFEDKKLTVNDNPILLPF